MGALTTASKRTSWISSLSPVGRDTLEKIALAGPQTRARQAHPELVLQCLQATFPHGVFVALHINLPPAENLKQLWHLICSQYRSPKAFGWDDSKWESWVFHTFLFCFCSPSSSSRRSPQANSGMQRPKGSTLRTWLLSSPFLSSIKTCEALGPWFQRL